MELSYDDDLYSPKYANGVFGGITSLGEIVMNFFIEVSPIPKSQTHEIQGEVIKPETIDREPKDDPLLPNVNRIISTGVIMSEATAITLSTWLQGQLEILKQLKHGSTTK